MISEWYSFGKDVWISDKRDTRILKRAILTCFYVAEWWEVVIGHPIHKTLLETVLQVLFSKLSWKTRQYSFIDLLDYLNNIVEHVLEA